ncbi:MAG: hypothetical protein OEN55_18730 [Alphaproteobacteria bacterium]|nr:hypothetical protein [Alphaproteobacteria bacterium]
MSAFLHIIWPLDGPPQTWDEMEINFDRHYAGMESKGMGRWFADGLTGAHAALVAGMDLGPYGFAHWYECIEEEGFPEEDDAWVSPDEMIAATWKLLSLIGNDDPDALTLVECYIQNNRTMEGLPPPFGQPVPRVLEGEDPANVARYRVEALGDLLNNLQAVVQTAHNCKREGIERVAFCLSG